ncbi:MAG: DUF971 domain-containing protein [Planctomycetota bacterium]|nr:MAG: DUF971 domain-containing protein [Planctomycetota bacterium]
MLQALKKTESGILFTWQDGLERELGIRQLRIRCPCAQCVSEVTGARLLDPSLIPGDLPIQDMKAVGNYAYRILFGDGHDTGIYTLEHLRQLCVEPPEE